MGNGLDAVRPRAGAPMSAAETAIFSPLYGLGANQIVPALQQMAPVIYADTLTVSRGSFRIVSGAIERELETRRGGPAAPAATAAPGPNNTTAWLSGIGQFQRLGNSGDGWAGYSSSSGGLVAGIDGTPRPGMLVGGALAFSRQIINATNASSYDGNALQLQAYGGLRHGIGFLDAQAGVAFTEGTARRNLALYDSRPSGKVSGTGVGGAVRAGVRIPVGDWTLEPRVTLSGVVVSQDGLSESATGAGAMRVGSDSMSSLQSVAGLRVDRRFASTTPRRSRPPRMSAGPMRCWTPRRGSRRVFSPCRAAATSSGTRRWAGTRPWSACAACWRRARPSNSLSATTPR